MHTIHLPSLFYSLPILFLSYISFDACSGLVTQATRWGEKVKDREEEGWRERDGGKEREG